MKLFIENKVVEGVRVHTKELDGYLIGQKYVPIDGAVIVEILDYIKLFINLFFRPQVPSVISIGDKQYKLTFVYDVVAGQTEVTGGYQNSVDGWVIKRVADGHKNACKAVHDELKSRGFI